MYVSHWEKKKIEKLSLIYDTPNPLRLPTVIRCVFRHRPGQWRIQDGGARGGIDLKVRY